MTNLWTGKITSTEYQKLTTISEISFEEGITYLLQAQNGDIYLREGTTGKGFIVPSEKVVQYTHDTLDLYVAKVFKLDDVFLNIAI